MTSWETFLLFQVIFYRSGMYEYYVEIFLNVGIKSAKSTFFKYKKI